LWSDQIATLERCADITVADITQHAAISEMAAAALEKSPKHFSLVGFSLGSQVALEIMRVSKDRVERLALLSATHGGCRGTRHSPCCCPDRTRRSRRVSG